MHWTVAMHTRGQNWTPKASHICQFGLVLGLAQPYSQFRQLFKVLK